MSARAIVERHVCRFHLVELAYGGLGKLYYERCEECGATYTGRESPPFRCICCNQAVANEGIECPDCKPACDASRAAWQRYKAWEESKHDVCSPRGSLLYRRWREAEAAVGRLRREPMYLMPDRDVRPAWQQEEMSL